MFALVILEGQAEPTLSPDFVLSAAAFIFAVATIYAFSGDDTLVPAILMGSLALLVLAIVAGATIQVGPPREIISSWEAVAKYGLEEIPTTYS